MKFLIDMPEDCLYRSKGGSVGVDLTAMQMAGILAAAKKAEELNAHLLPLYGYGDTDKCFDDDGKPVSLYAVERPV